MLILLVRVTLVLMPVTVSSTSLRVREPIATVWQCDIVAKANAGDCSNTASWEEDLRREWRSTTCRNRFAPERRRRRRRRRKTVREPIATGAASPLPPEVLFPQCRITQCRPEEKKRKMMEKRAKQALPRGREGYRY